MIEQSPVHSMLTENLAAVSKINKELADSLELYVQSGEQYTPPPPFTLEAQQAQLVYLSSGHFNHTVKPIDYNSPTYNAFDSCFRHEEISQERFDICYKDIHEDFHYAFFHRHILDDLKEKSIKLSSTPVTRQKPTFLIILGLAQRENIQELISSVSPLHVLLIETDLPHLVNFLSSTSITELQNHCKNLQTPCTFSISIGCGDPNDVSQELLKWTAHNSALGMEGLLISEANYPSIKRDVVRKFLSESTWHIDAVQRMGYQVDEYNMLYNTALNFESKDNRVFRPMSDARDSEKLPVVLTGSGPSLDKSLKMLSDNRSKYLLVSGGSSISTLLENGLRPDIHVQLERSEHQYDLHKSLSEKYDLSDILLICSSTVPLGLQSLFKRSIYFFRPALSPLAVYAVTPTEILTAEGPDTINAAVSSILTLGFKRISLFGVDCGSTSKKSIRSAGAFGGYIPRKLQKVERGASGKTVFTNSRLQTVRDSIAVAFRLARKSDGLNFSDGLNIPKVSYTPPDEFLNWLQDELTVEKKSDVLNRVWDDSAELNHHRVYTSWSVADPRQKCFNFFRQLEVLITKTTDIRVLVSKISDHISISRRRQTKADQLMPRITRGTLGKICPLILNIFYSHQHSSDDEVLNAIKASLLVFIDQLESDIYSVIDKIEPSQNNN